MNLWLRLIWYLVTAWRRPKLETTHEVSSLPFRVWPTDLDLSLHMNNGRYLTLMDLGRLDFMVRTGLWRPLLKHRWTPIANGIAIRFRRELRIFDRVQLETRLLAWSDVTVVMEQILRFDKGPRAGQVASRALFKGGLYDRKTKAYLPIERLMREIGVEVEQPTIPPDVEAFLKADDAIRAGVGAGNRE
jgi:acyl-CoA thioesterase FadM